MTKFIRLLIAALLAAITLAAPQIAYSQVTLTADWTNLGKANFEQINNGDTLTVGPNSVTINTSVVLDGDANDANFATWYSTGVLSYYTGQVGAQTGPLLYSMDHSIFDVGDYFESSFTFASSVQQLAFRLSDIDRAFGTSNYHDGIVIHYDNGDGTWRNLRTLTGSFTLGAAVGTTTLNGVQGFHGTAAAGLTTTDGDIAVNFGATTVKRVRIRYMFGQGSPTSDPTGNLQYAGLSDFTWQQPGVSAADLSLAKTVSNAAPAAGSTISYTLTLTNAGTSTSNNVVVRDQLPDGFTYQSFSGYGTYSNATGNWSVPTIASGQSRALTITGTVNAPAGVTITNIAEVFSTATYDPDSTPGNGIATEDDFASVAFTVQGVRTPGIPPMLSCPAGTLLFDWDGRSWTPGSLNNSYALTNLGNVNFAITSAGTWVNDATFGGLSPTLSSSNTGGLPTAELSLHQYLDFADRQQVATTVVTLPNGIAGAQFTVFDIDYAANDFADRLVVTGSYKGSTVMPTLTNGVVNYVIGNVAIGDGGSAGTSSDGNVRVTFSQPVDTITIVYGNANTAPANPDGQAIAIHDFSFCRPATTLSVTKTSAVISDPVNNTTNPKAIPGAVMQYSILVSNTGVSATDSNTVVVADNVPPQAKMCLADMAGAGSGPVRFVDGATSSGLTYTFGGLGNAGDSLAFSSDGGATWNYTPTPDGDGCDGAISDFRVTSTGAFRSGGTFTLQALFIVE